MKKVFRQIFWALAGLGLGFIVGTISDCCGLCDYVTGHKATVFTFGGLMVTSAIRVMPPPGTPFDLYTFMYDWSHQFFNLENRRLAPSIPILAPPLANPAAAPDAKTGAVVSPSELNDFPVVR
jgi:hypothetical protein